jgi:hypothetical protein
LFLVVFLPLGVLACIYDFKWCTNWYLFNHCNIKRCIFLNWWIMKNMTFSILKVVLNLSFRMLFFHTYIVLCNGVTNLFDVHNVCLQGV